MCFFPLKTPSTVPLYNQQIILALLLVIPYKTWFFRCMSSTEEASNGDLWAGTGAVGVTQCLSGLISLVLTRSGPRDCPALPHLQPCPLQPWHTPCKGPACSSGITHKWATRCPCPSSAGAKVRVEHRHNLKCIKTTTWGRANERLDVERELWKISQTINYCLYCAALFSLFFFVFLFFFKLWVLTYHLYHSIY